jgi:hypothetical protein
MPTPTGVLMPRIDAYIADASVASRVRSAPAHAPIVRMPTPTGVLMPMIDAYIAEALASTGTSPPARRVRPSPSDNALIAHLKAAIGEAPEALPRTRAPRASRPPSAFDEEPTDVEIVSSRVPTDV